ncbi:MAG TPA: HAD family phosphatase, partial [Cytophagaceae bacterium]
MNFSSIKNIIFDLGGVIINIDIDRTFRAFAQLTGLSFELVKERFINARIFERYEVGELSDSEFRHLINQTLGTTLEDEQIDEAWNTLLLDIPAERVRLIQQLRKKYKVFLLSNTNRIHIDGVNKILFESTGVPKLENLFDKIYYSWKIRLSKPSVTSYYEVLRDSSLKGEESLFLDDNVENIEGARLAGLHTLHVKPPLTII